MKLSYIIITLLVLIIANNIFNTCNIEGIDENNIEYAKNQIVTGPNSWYSLPDKQTLEFTDDDKQTILFYVCGNDIRLRGQTNEPFEWSSNECSTADCTLPPCSDGDTNCINKRNNAPVRIGTYCDKYDQSGGSETLSSNFESYVSQFISCPNKGDKIYGLHKRVNNDGPYYEFLSYNDAKTGICDGVINIYNHPFPEGDYVSGNSYDGSYDSGTAFTCENDNSGKTPCNHETDKLWQILT